MKHAPDAGSIPRFDAIKRSITVIRFIQNSRYQLPITQTQREKTSKESLHITRAITFYALRQTTGRFMLEKQYCEAHSQDCLPSRVVRKRLSIFCYGTSSLDWGVRW